jgi:FixJ family two-component response regulator
MNSPKPTLAIIEDDVQLRCALETLLGACGYVTTLFASALEFLTSVATCNADCLIVDIHLNDGSGLDLARHPAVRALQRPIVFMSGAFDPDLQLQALELSGNTYVRKPFEVAELLTAIERAMRTR